MMFTDPACPPVLVGGWVRTTDLDCAARVEALPQRIQGRESTEED
jgi:hypothetical protein